MVTFKFYGSDLQVHFDVSDRVRLKTEDVAKTAACMEWLLASTDETLKECQQIKQEMNLCDWAYLKLADKLSKAALGNTNEATLMAVALLNRSGYDVKFGWEGGKTLKLLFTADATIYRHSYYQMGEKFYYAYDKNDSTQLKVSDAEFGKGRPLTMKVNGDQHFAVDLSDPITRTSQKNEDFSFTYQVNKNLMEFYNDLPPFWYGDQFITRWTTMANVPLDKNLQETLVKQMKAKVAGMSQQDAVQQILWWIQGKLDLEMKNPNQACFLYAYDENVWGYDRPLYSEETLFYPYCDTEDRSVLLARLIRDVLGLKVIFIYYPGHTAVAVCITDADVKGAYVVQNGMHYVVCDPTYIGSDVGEEMPNMAGKEKTVMLLE